MSEDLAGIIRPEVMSMLTDFLTSGAKGAEITDFDFLPNLYEFEEFPSIRLVVAEYDEPRFFLIRSNFDIAESFSA